MYRKAVRPEISVRRCSRPDRQTYPCAILDDLDNDPTFLFRTRSVGRPFCSTSYTPRTHHPALICIHDKNIGTFLKKQTDIGKVGE